MGFSLKCMLQNTGHAAAIGFWSHTLIFITHLADSHGPLAQDAKRVSILRQPSQSAGSRTYVAGGAGGRTTRRPAAEQGLGPPTRAPRT